jgi:type II secretory pathway pseudopilin PulG
MFSSQKTNRYKRLAAGFSVIEMIVAIGLFAMVVVVALTSVLALVNANEKTRTARSALDNLGFTVEEMARALRFGQNYYCEAGSTPINLYSSNNRSECPNGGSYLAFEDRSGFINLYYYSATDKCIMKKVTNIQWAAGDFTDVLPPTSGHGYACISSDDVEVTYFKFHVHSWTIDSKIQRVTIVIRGYAGENPSTQSTFDFMTSVASRKTPVDY